MKITPTKKKVINREEYRVSIDDFDWLVDDLRSRGFKIVGQSYTGNYRWIRAEKEETEPVRLKASS